MLATEFETKPSVLIYYDIKYLLTAE